MLSSRAVLALLLACVWLACVHAAAFSPDGATQSSKSSKSSKNSKADNFADFMKALSGARRRDRKTEVDTNIIDPFTLIGLIISFIASNISARVVSFIVSGIIRSILLVFFFPLRLIGTLGASVIAVYLGCQVVPYFKCNIPFTDDKAEELVDFFQKELEFFMTFGDTD